MLRYKATGEYVDARTEVAKVQAGFVKSDLSKNRIEKVRQEQASSKETGTYANYLNTDLDARKQSFALNSYVAVTFFEGVRFRFWIGKVAAIAFQTGKGHLKFLNQRIMLNNVSDSLEISCSWYEPILENEACDIWNATRYKLITKNSRIQNKDFVKVKFVVSVVRLTMEAESEH